MAIKIRKSKANFCESCRSNGGKFYDIGFGPIMEGINVITLCDTCMHSLLQKLIIIGSKENEVQ